VVVTNYLWRPLLPLIVDSVAPGGVLIYETFASGNETVGALRGPTSCCNPASCSPPAPACTVVAYEDGYLDAPPRFVQRIAAVPKRRPRQLPLDRRRAWTFRSS
jgi:hypothetical protein